MSKPFFTPVAVSGKCWMLLLVRLSLLSAPLSLAAYAAEPPTPNDPLGEAIRFGEKIATQTRIYAKPYVGNALNCTSCHLNGGKQAFAAPWIGLPAVFPEYRPRSGRVNTLQQRINDCFQRSLNGSALPHDSREMVSLVAYMTWLSKGVPIGIKKLPGRGMPVVKAAQPPDETRGRQVYTNKCAACHGAEGQGLKGADGNFAFPPLWGDQSFNLAAGMARTNTAAGFVKANMPLGQGGTLTDQEALDVAQFFTHQPRPDYAEKTNDWPKGGKPSDARY